MAAAFFKDPVLWHLPTYLNPVLWHLAKFWTLFYGIYLHFGPCFMAKSAKKDPVWRSIVYPTIWESLPRGWSRLMSHFDSVTADLCLHDYRRSCCDPKASPTNQVEKLGELALH